MIKYSAIAVVIALTLVLAGTVISQSVPTFSLAGRYTPATPGAGIDMTGLLGPYTESVAVTTGGTVVVSNRTDGATTADLVTFQAGEDLSDATPADVGTAAAGTSHEASRSDHVHGPEAAGEGQAGSQGPEQIIFWGASSAVDYATISTAVGTLIGLLNTTFYRGSHHTATASENYFVTHVEQGSTFAGASSVGMDHIKLYDLLYEQVTIARPETFPAVAYYYIYPAVVANPNE